jgi:predicted PolB exonuclease-like 3'-5' exonuclease
MYDISELKQMVFIDIETIRGKKTYADLIAENPALQDYWQTKHTQIREREPLSYGHIEDEAEMYEKMAALYPEWGQIVCISIGQLRFDDGTPVKFAAKSFYDADEGELLEQFNDTARKIMLKYPQMQWVGHNIKGFDMPYIIKRSLINGLKVPKVFHLQKQKPWESQLLDTNDVWKFNGWNGARLGLLTEILNVPSPKQDMDGKMVSDVFWEDGNLNRISDYCEMDIKATANIMLRISGMDIVVDPPF